MGPGAGLARSAGERERTGGTGCWPVSGGLSGEPAPGADGRAGGEGCAGKYCSPLVLALGPASGDGDQGWDVVAALRRVGVLSPAGGGGGAGGAWSGGAGAGERERPRQHSGLARGPAVARSGSRKRREATRGWWFTRRVRERRAMRKGRGGSGNGPVSASKCCSPPAAGCRQWAGGLDDLAPGDGPGAG